jgi:ketosteroid isomerase-like protein
MQQMQHKASTVDRSVPRNIEVVKRLFEAFARRDVEAVVALARPDVKLLPVTAHLARGGRAYEGHAGIREYMADASRLWEELELVPIQYEAVVDAVVAIGEVRARGAGGELRQPTVWTWKLRDGLIVDGRVHSDVKAARQALGAPQ